MKSRSSAFAVATVSMTLTCACFLISGQSLTTGLKFAAPSGVATPEGAACDYLRAYIHRDLLGFTATRMHSFCETQLDIGRAFEALINGDQPIHITQSRESERAIRIVGVYPARAFELTGCQQQFMTAYLAIEHGGDRCLLVIVTTEDASGATTDHSIEVVQSGKKWKIAREELRNVVRRALPNAKPSTADWFCCSF